MWFIIVSVLLAIFYASLIAYYCSGWDKQKEIIIGQNRDVKICVIIPARNEEDNIGDCIESVLQQTYSKEFLEVIVVDDFSEDRTAGVVRAYPDVKLISLKDIIKEENVRSYKKLAITEAINQTNAELIITTDADCTSGKNWIETMVNYYCNSNAICIVGPVFIKEHGNFFYELQAMDQAAFTGIAAATIAQDKPVLCNGANFAFGRKAFFEVGGYEDVKHITSGDDLLLLHKFQKSFPERILFCNSPEAVVETNAMDNMPAFLRQRLRWASKSASYSSKKITLILALVYLFYVSIFASFFLSLNSKKYVYLLIGLLFVKMLADIIFMQRVLNFFNRRSLLSIFLPAQFFHIVYVIITGAAAIFTPLKWKGRKVYR